MPLQLPNLKQIYAARDCLKDVLIHDQQLVASIEKIEYAGQLERFGELHYIFKFREPGGPWLVGVSGGYKSANQIEPGDYVGSMGDAFNEATMKGSAIALLDDMKSFMEGEEAQAIQEAFEDHDIAGVISHVRDIAAQAGLTLSEEEIKNRITEILNKGGAEALDENETRTARRLARLSDKRFFPGQYSQTILLDTPELFPKQILKEIRKRKYPLQHSTKGGDSLLLLLADGICKITLKKSVETPAAELRRAASMNYVRQDMAGAISKAHAELVVSVLGTGGEAWGEALFFEDMMDTCLAAIGDHALAVYTGAVLQAVDVYRGCIKMTADPNMVPLDNLVWACMLPDKSGTAVRLRVDGLRAFGVPDIMLPEPVPASAVNEAINDAYGIAFVFLQEHKDPEYEERVMGADGRQYFAYPEDAAGGGPGTVTLEITDEILMDDADLIRENLHEAGVKAAQFSRMNRAGFFIRWAEKKGFLTEQTKKELAAYDGPNGLRGYLYYDWDGAPDASLFIPEVRPFIAEYYNVNRMEEKTYFEDLDNFAMEKLAGTKKEADAKKVPEESHALLRWGEKTAEGIGEIIERRYRAWKRRKR